MLELTLTPTGVNQVRVAVNGTPAHRFDLGAIAPTAEGGRVIPDDPAAYGRALYAALFPPDGPAAEALTALPAAPDPRATLLLVLDHPVLDAIPWELLHDGARFLALDFYLLRGLPPDRRRAAWSEARLERLPILFLPASPLLSLQGEPEERPLAVLEEWEALREAIAGLDAPYDLVQVLPPTLDALDEALADVATGIVHFAGHGTVTEEGAFLLFEQPNGASHPVPADHFVRRVRGKARLVFLNACLTAAPARTDLAGLARALVAQGIPYALGMQFTVPDATARRFAARFYTYLARSHPVEEAVRRARMALEEEPLLMAIPVLYTGLSRPRARFPLAEGQARVRTPPPPPERVDLSDLPPVEGEFVGRQRELVDLGDLLTGEARPPAITIHGGGGMGKTALAREAARRFAWAFPDGVLTLSLERLPSPERLLTRLGDFLGLPRDPEEPVRRWRHRVEEALRARRLLLVVDNAETLVRAVEGERGEEGGAEEQEERARARAIGGLLRRAVGGKTTLLLTGRAVVGLPREEVVPLTGLTPSAGARLFAQHAGTGRERADRAEMEALSRQVGGHPLALRLLAAAFEDFPRSLADFRKGLAARLPTVEDPWSEEARHESLWACFDYSYEALPRELQERFPRLALFTAPFPPEVVAAVLGEAEEAVGEWLHRLWRRGMVERVKVVDPTGWALLYRLHPTLGAYAEAKAGEAVLAPLRPAFGEAYAALAAHAYGTIWQKPVLAQVVQRMLPDLERAVGWVEDEGRASAFRFHLGWLLRHYGDLEGAMGLYREALEIDGSLGDQRGRSATLHVMAGILAQRGDLEGAMGLYREALEIVERLGDQRGRSATLHEMAGILADRGDLEGAMGLYREALETLERLGDQRGRSATLHAMAGILADRGDLEGAMRFYRESLEIDERLGDQQGRSATLHEMAYILRVRGDLEGAMGLYREALEVAERLGDQRGRSATLHEMAGILAQRGDLEGAMGLYRESLAIKERLGDQQGMAITLGMMGQTLWAMERHADALRALVSGLALLQRLGIEPQTQRAMAEVLIRWRQELGPERFDPLWQEATGQPLPPWLREPPGGGRHRGPRH